MDTFDGGSMSSVRERREQFEKLQQTTNEEPSQKTIPIATKQQVQKEQIEKRANSKRANSKRANQNRAN